MIVKPAILGFLFLCACQAADDPCTMYKPYPDADKRSPEYLYRVANPISDQYLREAWYGSPGRDLATTPPAMERCGTRYPVWLKDSTPTEALLCMMATAKENCKIVIKLEKKSCGAFPVYKLKRTHQQNSAYCVVLGDSDDGQNVEILGYPMTPNLLTRLLHGQQEAVIPTTNATKPTYSTASLTTTSPPSTNMMHHESTATFTQHFRNPSTSGHSTEKDIRPIKTSGKRKAKPEDTTQLQFEVLQKQKKKLVAQRTYYELMNEKLRQELKSNRSGDACCCCCK